MTSAGLSARSGIDTEAIDRAEFGRQRLDAAALQAIARAMNIHVSELFPPFDEDASVDAAEAEALQQLCLEKIALCSDPHVLKNVLRLF